MWTIAIALIILSPILFALLGGKTHKLKKQWNVFKVSAFASFGFIFTMKSEERLEVFRRIHSLYPRFLHFDFLKLRVLLIYDPEIAKKFFNSVQCMQRPYRSFIPLEKGLLFATYADWREPRKHLNLAFNLNVLKGFIPIFSKYSNLTIKEMESHLDGGEFDLLLSIAQLAFRTVSATLLNVHRVELSKFQQLFDSINMIGECLAVRIANPIIQPDFIYKLTSVYKREKIALDFLMQYGNELIDEARQRHKNPLASVDENENVVKPDSEPSRAKVNFIIDQLINHEEKFSDQEIREHLLTLQITASDTTINLVGACFMYLAMNQDVQQKVFDEVEEIFGEDFNIEYERLNEMKYMEMVLKETLRLFSPIPVMMREAHEDCDVGTGKTLKKGTRIFTFLYILHRRKDIWGYEADKFNPQNFSPENTAKRNPYSFLPFGSGLRNCIGNRYTMIAAKIFVAKLVKAYKFTTRLTEKDMKMKLTFTGKLASKYLVTIEKR